MNPKRVHMAGAVGVRPGRAARRTAGRHSPLASCGRTAQGHGSWTWVTVFQLADWEVPLE